MTYETDATTTPENIKELFGYLLRAHVSYQDGRNTQAPALLYAGADYEAEDGTAGLSADGKYVNEPAIIYARADALIDSLKYTATVEAELEKAREWNRQMVAKAASGGTLEGYRDMGAKITELEKRLEELGDLYHKRGNDLLEAHNKIKKLQKQLDK